MAEKRTEAEVLAMLRRRVEQQAGNGPAAVMVTHVRDAAGHSARRTLDAMSMALWPSRGLVIDGYEVKCSRGDWLRELKNPAKADGFCEKVDRFWLVVADEAFVRPGELPDTWGLLAVRGGKLHEVESAPLLRLEKASSGASLPPGVSRTFLAALLRSAAAVGGVPAETMQAIRDEAERDARERAEHRLKYAEERAEKLAAAVGVLEKAAGVRLTEWSADEQFEAVGAAIRTAMSGESTIAITRRRLENMRDEVRRIQGRITETLGDGEDG